MIGIWNLLLIGKNIIRTQNKDYGQSDPGFLPTQKMVELYDSGEIKFLPKYEEKFLKEYYNKKWV